MSMRGMFKWLVISVGVVCALFVVLIFYAICGPRPKPVSGTDRPDWLPATATDVFHKSQGGFGWWRAAEFTISEVDFRAYADSRGWHLTEAQNVIPPGLYHLGRPSVIRNKDGEEQLVLIPKALLYQKLASNNGGIRAAYDLEAQRAYYSESHR